MTVSLLSESICFRYACRLGAGFVLAVMVMMVVIGMVNPNAPPSCLPAKCARGLAWLKTQLDIHRDMVGEYPAGDNWWSQADIYNRYGGEDPATGRPIDPFGYPLRWSSDEALLWSIGVNGLDEHGLGDDICCVPNSSERVPRSIDINSHRDWIADRHRLGHCAVCAPSRMAIGHPLSSDQQRTLDSECAMAILGSE